MIEYSNLPIDILLRMMECQQEQGNKKDASVFKNKGVNAPLKDGGFSWIKTKEGLSFWGNVLDHENKKEFYARYPEKFYAYCPCKMYPQEIQDCIITRLKETSSKVYDREESISLNICFTNTIEGYDFWHQIFEGNLKVFYDKYPTGEFLKRKEETKVTNLPLTYETLPQDILLKMMEYQEEQGNPRDASVFKTDIKSDSYHKGFNWFRTLDGDDFWSDVIKNGNINVFYEKYPKVNYSNCSCKMYPQEIQDCIITRLKERKEEYDENKTLSSNLYFTNTIEGHDFWQSIFLGNIKTFYDKYPNQSTICITHPSINIESSDQSTICITHPSINIESSDQSKVGFKTSKIKSNNIIKHNIIKPCGWVDVIETNPIKNYTNVISDEGVIRLLELKEDNFIPIKIKKYY